MELDAFTCRLGLGQGRIQPTTVSPAAGEFVFVLGEDEPGCKFEFTPGDYAVIVQDMDLSGVDLIRAQLIFRVPGDLPAGLTWEVSMVVDGQKVASAIARPGQTRRLTDLAANVSKLAGTHPVGVRLELVST